MNRYIVPIFFLLVSVALYLSYISPTYIEIQKALVREHELSGYIADAKTAQVKIDALKAQYAAFPAGADQALHALLPDSIDPTRLVVDMDAVVSKLGLVMKSPNVALEAGTDGSPLDVYRVSFSVSAPYAVFRDFLHNLEASLALRDMGTLSFKTSDSGGSTGPNAVHDYGLSISTYSLHQ